MIFTQAQYQAYRNITVEASAQAMERIKANFINGNVGKDTRPWFVLDFPSLLPQGATMFGFEIETGFSSEHGKTSMMCWLWDNTDYTTVDREGCSSFPVEITFPPIVAEQLLNEDNQLLGWFRHNASLADNNRARTRIVGSREMTGGCVGTHTNISTAAYRSAARPHRTAAQRSLQTLFMGLTSSQKVHLFGRMPYIDDVARGRGGEYNGGDGAARIEFKMFHTTLNIEQFKRYCKVSLRLAEVIDLCLIGNTPANSTAMFEYLTQDLPARSVICDESVYAAEHRRGYDPSYTPIQAAA